MILEAMYNGEFYPCETVVPTSPEYRKAVIACEKLMEQLSQRLSKEDYELVQELRAQTAIAQCEESESHFKYDFSAGLMCVKAHELLARCRPGHRCKAAEERKIDEESRLSRKKLFGRFQHSPVDLFTLL